MKYYGMTFNKFKSSKRMLENQSFDNEYDALNYANAQWNAENDDAANCMRLLVVMGIEKQSQIENIKYAFFQFDKFVSCNHFIQSKEEIIWTSEDGEIWNGNIHIMG